MEEQKQSDDVLDNDDVIDNDEFLETLKNPRPPQPPKRRSGGAQPGAGRPKGTINKISGAAILEAIDNTLGIPFQIQLALNYQRAIFGSDPNLIAKYDQFLLNKVVADRVDITSNGQSIAPIIEMNTQELPDYTTIIDIDVKSS
jgi:hypothetical protein